MPRHSAAASRTPSARFMTRDTFRRDDTIRSEQADWYLAVADFYDRVIFFEFFFIRDTWQSNEYVIFFFSRLAFVPELRYFHAISLLFAAFEHFHSLWYAFYGAL